MARFKTSSYLVNCFVSTHGYRGDALTYIDFPGAKAGSYIPTSQLTLYGHSTAILRGCPEP